jgi:hypothetical protein
MTDPMTMAMMYWNGNAASGPRVVGAMTGAGVLMKIGKGPSGKMDSVFGADTVDGTGVLIPGRNFSNFELQHF